ncbi:winged helix-turn-helix transcriptional regulator [Elizabethkingia anophelis]|nr:winged helix-turn-helix transcriptional regulator [Elizabethkingia anophelis]
MDEFMIKTRMLVRELKNNEENGIVNREALATVPPTVKYNLSAKERKLELIINDLYQWDWNILIIWFNTRVEIYFY